MNPATADVLDPELVNDREPQERRPPDRRVRLSPEAWELVQRIQERDKATADEVASRMVCWAGRLCLVHITPTTKD